ncbi:MAG TPA: hypothetical protein VIM16_05790 [Mucilaginibacter sp.]|jgi:hypothetical protein
MTKHVHSEVIKAWADGAQIELEHRGNWFRDPNPYFFDSSQYRVYDPHRELKAAQAAGKTIQFKTGDKWTISSVLYSWCYPVECYRIKPEVKPDKVIYGGIANYNVFANQSNIPLLADNPNGDLYYDVVAARFSTLDAPGGINNLKLTFDGETGKLKKAEVI